MDYLLEETRDAVKLSRNVLVKDAAYESLYNNNYNYNNNTSIDLSNYNFHGIEEIDKRLWSLVKIVVEKDRRIQSIDMVVDGSPKSCWRILPANIHNEYFSPKK